MAVIFGRDTFVDTQGVQLNAHTPDVGGSWIDVDNGHFGTALITGTPGPANMLRIGVGLSSAIYILSADPGSPDYTVEDDVTVESLAAYGSLGLVLKCQQNTPQFSLQYYYTYYQGASTRWVVSVGGAAATQVLVPGHVYHRKFSISGAVLSLDIDGVNVITVTDPDPFGIWSRLNGWCGYIVVGDGSSPTEITGYLSDNFLAYTGDVITTADFGLYFAGSGIEAGEDFTSVAYGAPTPVSIEDPQTGWEYAIPVNPVDLAGFLSGRMGNVKLRRSGTQNTTNVVCRAISIKYKKT